MNIILTISYFYADHNYFFQSKGAAKNTTGVVVYANLHVLIKKINRDNFAT